MKVISFPLKCKEENGKEDRPSKLSGGKSSTQLLSEAFKILSKVK